MNITRIVLAAGLKLGVILAVFQLGSLVLHNYMMLNIGWRLSALQGIVYSAADRGRRRDQSGLSRLRRLG